jgi:hypothetical protein
VSLAAHSHHRCTVERPVRSLDGQRNATTRWASHLAGVACRLVVKTQRVPAGVLAEEPVITTYTLLIPGDVDVRQGDRIVDVVDQAGAVVDAGPFRIAAALPRRAASIRHRSYQLERLGGPYARATS